MKSSPICNERIFIGLKGQDRITYTFVTDNEITPSSVTIRCGDRDPMTGRDIPEICFREYHRIRNREIYHNSKAERSPFTAKEKEERNRERRHIAETFRKEHGYMPGEDTVEYLLEKKWGCRYNIHLEAVRDEYGDSMAECCLPMEDPAAQEEFIGNETDEILMLREFASSLRGRLLDVYRMMLEKAAGGAGGRLGKDLAKKWGISPSMIVKDERKIIRMLKAFRECWDAD